MKKDYGCKIENMNKMSKIIVDDEKSYCLDLFFFTVMNGKCIRTYTNDFNLQQLNYIEEYLPNIKGNEWWWNGFDFEYGLIESRKKFNNDDLLLYGPNNPDTLLKIWYGSNYLTICKTHYLKNHEEYVEPEEKSCGNLPSPQL